MKKPFLGVYNPSIILTYLGVFFSVTGMAILFSTERADASENMKWVLILLVLAGICDMFDGLVARRCKRTEKEKQFGIQLDSLADTVSFVAFPACILLFMCGLDVAGIIIAFFYIFAGIMRLGWFNVTTEENKGVYQGMPVTFFKAGDVEDLAEKLLSAWQLPPPVLRENRYSFKKTAAIIFDAMERIVARR